MNQTLDINTPRGRIAAADQLRAVEIVFGGHAEFGFIHTATDDSANVDGFIVRSWIATGVAEVKSRNETLADMMGKFKAEWLLTYQKLLDVQAVSRLLQLPSYGMLYLKPDDTVVMVRFTDKDGTMSCRYRVATTETQKCCNGGTATRENAFISIRSAKIYKGQ